MSFNQSNFIPPAQDQGFNEISEAKETLEILFEISQILNCGIDRTTLSILVSLCENGVNPEALAAVIKEIRRESEAIKMEK